jgi:carbon monoxide dehydrogenase subunit G
MLGKNGKKQYIALLIILWFVTGCGIYSFTGANFGNAKTVTVHIFVNKASIVNPELAPMLTEKLQDKFITESPLTVVERDGDLEFSGTIIEYKVAPAQIQAGETAVANKLTIKVRVKFVNHLDPKNNYESTFSWYAEFDPNLNLASVEHDLIDEITDKLVDDIFNKAVANW